MIGEAGEGLLQLTSGAKWTTDGPFQVGLKVTGDGTIEASGGDSLFTAAGDLTVGLAGSGEVKTSAGGHAMLEGDVVLGHDRTMATGGATTPAFGALTADGVGSEIKIASRLTMGLAGNAGLSITGGGKIVQAPTQLPAPPLEMAVGVASDAVVSVTSGMLDWQGDVRAGVEGSAHISVFAGSTMRVGQSLAVGSPVGDVDSAIVDVTGGDARLTVEKSLAIHSHGVVHILGGGRLEVGPNELPLVPAESMTLNGTEAAPAIATVSGAGSILDVARGLPLLVGNESERAGGIDVDNGGALNAGSITLGDAFNSDGLLQITGDSGKVNVYTGVIPGFGGAGALIAGRHGSATVELKADAGEIVARSITLGADEQGFGRLVQSGAHSLIRADQLFVGTGKGQGDLQVTGGRLELRTFSLNDMSASFSGASMQVSESLHVGVDADLPSSFNVGMAIREGAVVHVGREVQIGKKGGPVSSLTFAGLSSQLVIGSMDRTPPEGYNVLVTSGGVLKGDNRLTGHVVAKEKGAIVVGSSPGKMTIDGNLTLESDGFLDMEVAGFDAGVNYDQLVVTGLASLAGIVRLSFTGDAPHAGDKWQLISAPSSLNATGLRFEFTNLQPGFQYETQLTAGGLWLQALNTGRLIPEPRGIMLLPVALVLAGAPSRRRVVARLAILRNERNTRWGAQ